VGLLRPLPGVHRLSAVARSGLLPAIAVLVDFSRSWGYTSGMRAAPLAVCLLFVRAASASAEECPIPMRVAKAFALPLDRGSPTCRAALELVSDFEKVREAAGFAPEQLIFSIDPDQKKVNAYYGSGQVSLTSAFLKDESRGRDARVMTIAHEIGHAVQDRDKLIAWKYEPKEAHARRIAGAKPPPSFTGSPEEEEFLARSRRLEAHADAIGHELLQRAGYAHDLFARGEADFFGCDGVERLRETSSSHPVSPQRFLNTALTSGAAATEHARDVLRRQADAFGETSAEAPLVAAAAESFVPRARLEDYDGQGRALPGRRVAERLAVPLPPREEGALGWHAAFIASSAVDFWIVEPFQSAIDRLSTQESVASQVLAACGKPETAELYEEFGVLGWTRRIAADAARSLARLD